MINDYPKEHRNAIAVETAYWDHKHAFRGVSDAIYDLDHIEVDDDPEVDAIVENMLEKLLKTESTLDEVWRMFDDLKREMFGEQPESFCSPDCGPGAGE